jgi:PAS domain S-box-containing protein
MFDSIKSWKFWMVPLFLSAFLIAVSQYNMLAFHTFAELFAIVISFVMFAFAWSTYRFSSNKFLLILACGYFWIGYLDVIHTLTFKGMNIFNYDDGNVSIQFWIGTRYLEALLLLAAPFVATRSLNRHLLLLSFGLVAVSLTFLIATGIFPQAYIDGVGLTAFKIYSEYLIVLLLIFAIVVITRNTQEITHNEKTLLIFSVVFTIIAELTFTLYVSVLDMSIVVGHIFKIISFWFILQAIVISNLQIPFLEIVNQRNYNRNLFETSLIGLALSKMDGTLLDVNSAYAKIIGRTVEETINMNYWDFTSEKYTTEQKNLLGNLKEIGRYGHYEKEYIHKDGHLVPVEISDKVIELNGEPVIWSSIQDITVEKQLKEQVQHSQKMETIGQLTGGIAHDFNNILGIVSGNLELLQRMLPADSKEYERVENALRGATRGASITRKLLNFSSKDAIDVKPTNINDFIVNSMDLIKKSLTPSIKVETNLGEKLWITEVDQGDFEDALLNISLNAHDAMLDGGTLTITTSNQVLHNLNSNILLSDSADNKSDFVTISITDNGTGMSEEVRDKVLEPFFTTKDKSKGTGLGLSMVHGFVNRSGGRIEINSIINEGSTFKLFLPRTKQEVKLNSSQSIDVEYPKGNEIVLVVDDEEALCEIAKNLLTELGYTVLTASSGDEAMKIVETGVKIDLLFSDVVMPGKLDGYKLAIAAHKLQPELNILLTSGFSQKRNEVFSEDNEYISKLLSKLLAKPYSQLELGLAIHRALNTN